MAGKQRGISKIGAISELVAEINRRQKCFQIAFIASSHWSKTELAPPFFIAYADVKFDYGAQFDGGFVKREKIAGSTRNGGEQLWLDVRFRVMSYWYSREHRLNVKESIVCLWIHWHLNSGRHFSHQSYFGINRKKNSSFNIEFFSGKRFIVLASEI